MSRSFRLTFGNEARTLPDIPVWTLELQRYAKHAHIGPYHELPQKWQALKAALAARGESVAMPLLEVYGHACECDDDSKAETAIRLRLNPQVVLHRENQ